MADLSQLTGVERTKRIQRQIRRCVEVLRVSSGRTKKSGSDRCGSVNERSQTKK